MGELIYDFLKKLSASNTSSDVDSALMQRFLRIAYPQAVVIAGIVYLEGYGNPLSIHSVAKNILLSGYR